MSTKGSLPYLTNGLILLFILFTVTPVKLIYSSITIIMLVVLALWALFFRKVGKPGSNTVLFVVSIPLVIYLLGLLNTSNLSEGTSYVTRNASLVAFPFIFYTLGKWIWRKVVFNGFLIALSVTNLYLIYLFLYYFNFGALFYKLVTVDIFHSTYLGMYNLAAFWICVDLYRRKYSKLYALLAVFFIISSLLPASRIIFILATLSLLSSLFLLIGSKKKILGWVVVLGLLITGILIGTPAIRQKFDQLTELERVGFDRSNYKSISSRLGKIEAVTTVIGDYPFFGTGTGDLMDVLVEEYREMKFTMGYKYRYNPHNQFLDNLARNGLFGGAIALGALYIFPLWRGFVRRDLLLFSFSLLVAGVSLTESIMDVHKGITFYAFFMSCLIWSSTPEGSGIAAEDQMNMAGELDGQH